MTISLRSSHGQQYDPVSSERQSANDDDDADDDADDDINPDNNSKSNSTTEEGDHDDAVTHPATTNTTTLLDSQQQRQQRQSVPSLLLLQTLPTIRTEIKVLILDYAQTRFVISADPNWISSNWQEMSFMRYLHNLIVYSIWENYFRIYRRFDGLWIGSGLDGDTTTEARIVHSFPKDNIQVVSNTTLLGQQNRNHNNNEEEEEGNNNNNDSRGGGRAPIL